MTTTPSTASQAPAVSIENDWHSRANVLEARLGEVMEKRDEWRAMAEKAMDDVADHYNRLCKAEARATAAEAKLEAIRQNLENLDRYDADYQRGDGVWLVVKGAYIDRADALALFKPQPQADESGLPG